MARALTGSVYPVKGGHGIRWIEQGRTVRRGKPPFPTKTAARDWFDQNVKPRLRSAAPAPSAERPFDEFCERFLEAQTTAPSTVATLRDRLRPARERFGNWKLSDLEYAAADIAAWRASLPEGSRFRHTAALRQCLAAAVRWRYLTRNPAVDAGPNPKPRRPEVDPITPDELSAILAELGPPDRQLVAFAAATGLRPEEWCALERHDRDGHRMLVQRKYAKGRLTPYPKTAEARRSVPLSDVANDALEQLPPRIDTPLIFPAAQGGHRRLDNWRSRVWYPALGLAGVRQRGVYALRHTFATEALAAGIAIFELSRILGTSAEMISATYGHLAHDSEDTIRARLNARSLRISHELVTNNP